MNTLDRRYDKAAKEMEKREFYPQRKRDDSYKYLNVELQRRQTIPGFGPGFPFSNNPYYTPSLPAGLPSATTPVPPHTTTSDSHGSSATITYTPVISPTTHGTTGISDAPSISGITSIPGTSQTFSALSGSQSSTLSVPASNDNTGTTTGIPTTTFAAIITIALFVALISAVAAYVSFKKYRKHERGRVQLLDGTYISTMANALAHDGSFDGGQPPMRMNRGSTGTNSNNGSKSRISLANAATGGAVVSTAVGQRESHNEPPSSTDDERMEPLSNPFGDHASISNVDEESALTGSSARASDMTLNIEDAFPMPPSRSFDVSRPESTKEDD